MVVALAEFACALQQAVFLEKLFIHMMFALAEDQRNELLGVFAGVFEDLPHFLCQKEEALGLIRPSEPDTPSNSCNEVLLEIVQGRPLGLVGHGGAVVSGSALRIDFVLGPVGVLVPHLLNGFLDGCSFFFVFLGLEN